jgi:hypothetical protein
MRRAADFLRQNLIAGILMLLSVIYKLNGNIICKAVMQVLQSESI